MKNSLKSAMLVAMLAVSASAAPAMAATVVPCENVLKDLRAMEAKAKISDADMAKVKELEAKGIDRCNADDDKRADKFFDEAMKILKAK